MKIKSVAVVTGASQGIGQATALRLARDFSVIVLTARQESELEKTASAVKLAGAEPLVYALDLREPSSAEMVVKGTLERFGRIDALLNIAGAVMTGRRQSFFENWAPAHNMSVEEAMKRFPEEAGISRFGKPEEIADLMAYLVSPAAKWMTGSCVRMDGGEVKGI